MRRLRVAALAVLLTLGPASARADQPADGVSVATDQLTYHVGEPIGVRLTNGGTDRITRGGLVCDDVWPLAIEQLAPDGSWQTVAIARRATCIAVAGVLIAPGDSQTRSISQPLDRGTYRIAYTFDVVGGAAGQTAYSDALDVLDGGGAVEAPSE